MQVLKLLCHPEKHYIYDTFTYVPDLFIFSGLFDTTASGKECSVAFYNNWVRHVKQTVPADRLLVFEPKQGWQPLCKFLNLPTPEGSFPHVNDTPAMLWNIKKLKLLSYTVVYVIPVIIASLLTYTMYS